MRKKTQQVRKVLEGLSSNIQENEAYGLLLDRGATHKTPDYEEVTESADYERVDDFAHHYYNHVSRLANIPNNHPPNTSSLNVQSRDPAYVNVIVDVAGQ